MRRSTPRSSGRCIPTRRACLRSLPHLSPRRGKLPSIPGRVPSITEMPNGCRFRARCSYATDGLRGRAGTARCRRRAQGALLALQGARAARRAAAPRHSSPQPKWRRGNDRPSARQHQAAGRHRVGARPRGALSDAGSPRHREGGRWRDLRRPPRRDIRHHRRVRIGQDDDRPRAGVPAEADRRRDPAQRRRPASPAAPGHFKAIAATTRSSFRTRTPRSIRA